MCRHYRFSPPPPGCSLHYFQLLTVNEIESVSDRSHTNTPAERQCWHPSTVPCLLSGSVPVQFKVACITQWLKKIDLDPDDPKSYQPIADDTQTYGFCAPSDAVQLQSQMSTCVDEEASWMCSNWLSTLRHCQDGGLLLLFIRVDINTTSPSHGLGLATTMSALLLFAFLGGNKG